MLNVFKKPRHSQDWKQHLMELAKPSVVVLCEHPLAILTFHHPCRPPHGQHGSVPLCDIEKHSMKLGCTHARLLDPVGTAVLYASPATALLQAEAQATCENTKSAHAKKQRLKILVSATLCSQRFKKKTKSLFISGAL